MCVCVCVSVCVIEADLCDDSAREGSHGMPVVRGRHERPPRHLPVKRDFRTTTSQNCEVVPWRARVGGSYIFVSLNYRLEIH